MSEAVEERFAVLEVAWTEGNHELELHIDPFGEVSHAAVDAADDGAGFPVGFLVDLGGTVELGSASLCREAALEVHFFRFGQCICVLLE